MLKTMGVGMQVVVRCVPSFVFMLKRRGNWMEWNCCMQFPLVWNLQGCMEQWCEKEEGIHANGVFFYVRKQQIVQSVLSEED